MKKICTSDAMEIKIFLKNNLLESSHEHIAHRVALLNPVQEPAIWVTGIEDGP